MSKQTSNTHIHEHLSQEISIPVISISAIICTIITIILIYQLYCNTATQSQNARNKSSKNQVSAALIIICVIACTLCEYCDIIRWILCASTNRNLFFYPLNQIMSIADLFYYIGAISFYCIAIYRLKASFQDSAYDIHPYLLTFFKYLIVCSSILAIYYCIIVALQPKHGANEFFTKYDTVATVLLMAIDITMNICLMTLFICKLKQLLTETLSRNSINEIGSSIDSLSFNMIDLITRHSLLFGIAIITNQLFFITVVIVFWGGGLSKNMHFLVFCARACENTANCLVLFLGLARNHRYYRMLCSECHSKMAMCCICDVQYKLNHKNSRKQLDYQKMNDHEMISISNKP